MLPQTAKKSTSRIVSTNDGFCYQTRNDYPLHAALKLAQKVENNPNFQDVYVVEGRKDRYQVRMFPRNTEALLAKVRAEAKRIAREEGMHYHYEPLPLTYEWLCTNTLTNQTYTVGSGHCSCPHFKFSASIPGKVCKHILEARNRGFCNLFSIEHPAVQEIAALLESGFMAEANEVFIRYRRDISDAAVSFLREKEHCNG